MDEVKKTRFKVLTGLAVVVVVVHIILIKIFVLGGTGPKPVPAPQSKVEPGIPVAAPAVPAPVSRYFVRSKNPRFGAPFDYTGTIRGNLPAQTVPGSS
ncbi:MAG: hypothetical protein IKZ33_07360, partial [Lentisphaeria bacterium]|nr:hypothetical protein [Lentisphaeria bacterium]